VSFDHLIIGPVK